MNPSRKSKSREIKKLLGRLYTTFLLITDNCLQAVKLKPKFFPISKHGHDPDQSCSKVAIFAAYINSDSEMLEAERILKLLDSEFDLTILVNTGSVALKIDYLNFQYIQRENFGRDIASYKYALDSLNLARTSEIFFLNDSVLWAGESILKFLANARKSNFEVTSLTSSDQYSFHLQSYALHLKGNIKEISKAFSVIRISNIKRVIVEAGEKKLSNYWNSKQIQIGSIYSQLSLIPLLTKYKDLYEEDYADILNLSSQDVPLNPSIHLWAPLYEQSGVIKKVLMSKNPAKLKYVPKTLKEVQSRVGFNDKLN